MEVEAAAPLPVHATGRFVALYQKKQQANPSFPTANRCARIMTDTLLSGSRLNDDDPSVQQHTSLRYSVPWVDSEAVSSCFQPWRFMRMDLVLLLAYSRLGEPCRPDMHKEGGAGKFFRAYT